MNPTAEDILNKHLREDLPKGKNVVLTYVETRHLLAAMEEYSLLKSKAAADKAWEAAPLPEPPSKGQTAEPEETGPISNGLAMDEHPGLKEEQN
jgi:hypothetical protein